MTELEQAFNLLMKSIADRAKRECNYNPTRFMKMLADHGGVETAKLLLRAPSVSDGFVELFLRNRLDLTLEAQLMEHPEFWDLFSEREIDTARRWHKEYLDKSGR